MPEFSKSSLNKLNQAHPDLQLIFNEVVKTTDCTIIESYRDKDAQEKAFNEGKSKLHYPKGSHNSFPSKAVDVAPYPISWDDTKRFYVFWGVVKTIVAQLFTDGRITHKIRWGGDWNGNDNYMDQAFNDLVHFEIIE